MNKIIEQICAKKKAEREAVFAKRTITVGSGKMISPRPVPILSKDTITEQKLQTINFLSRFWFKKGKCSATKPKI